jgi:hypothetical protein
MQVHTFNARLLAAQRKALMNRNGAHVVLDMNLSRLVDCREHGTWG